MDTPKFTRVKEDFICEKCGFAVSGSGYTNHCPKCLWSKHVDINPGDRAAECGGLMQPVGLRLEKGEQAILHRCVACKHEKWNKTDKVDDFEEILKLSKNFQ